MRIVTFIAGLCLCGSVAAEGWNYDGPIQIMTPGESNQGVEITETEHQKRLNDHQVINHSQDRQKNFVRFPNWLSSK